MKRFVYECLHDPFDRKARFVNGVLSFLIIFSIAILPLEVLPLDYAGLHEKLDFIEKTVVTIFLVEYFLRIWSHHRPPKFILSWEGIIDLVAILPFFLEKFEITTSVGIFVVLRILRIFKFITIFHLEQSALSKPRKKKYNQLYMVDHEEIKRIVFKHPIVFIVRLMLPLFLTSSAVLTFVGFEGLIIAQITSGLVFSVAILFFIKYWLDFNYDTLFITNFRVIVQDHQLFGANINSLRYESINNIVPDNRGFFQWVFDIGRLEIETASDLSTMVFNDVRDPHKIAQEIENHRGKNMTRKIKPVTP